VSNNWGYDRGTPIDRWYIDRFLGRHRDDIHGRALEVKGAEYVTRFGHDLEHIDILDFDATNERATFIADLETADVIPDATFDCVVITQVVQYCLDVKAALTHCARILKPDGVLLLTVPGINKVEDEYELFRFTQAGCRRAAEHAFGEGNVEIDFFGNSRPRSSARSNC
jgi:SAM-dependent methyltransferase